MAFGKIDPARPFEHLAHNGTKMLADRCDLRGGYELHRPQYLTDEKFASDVAEIFCWFWANIVPELNGFNLPQCRKIYIIKD